MEKNDFKELLNPVYTPPTADCFDQLSNTQKLEQKCRWNLHRFEWRKRYQFFSHSTRMLPTETNVIRVKQEACLSQDLVLKTYFYFIFFFLILLWLYAAYMLHNSYGLQFIQYPRNHYWKFTNIAAKLPYPQPSRFNPLHWIRPNRSNRFQIVNKSVIALIQLQQTAALFWGLTVDSRAVSEWYLEQGSWPDRDLSSYSHIPSVNVCILF